MPTQHLLGQLDESKENRKDDFQIGFLNQNFPNTKQRFPARLNVPVPFQPNSAKVSSDEAKTIITVRIPVL